VWECGEGQTDTQTAVTNIHFASAMLRRGRTAEEATNDIISVQLPDIRRRMDSGQLHIDNMDVFCEEGVFNVDQTRRILTAGQAAGLAANFHGEELHCLHSAEVYDHSHVILQEDLTGR